ncbi:MAG: hypothetical protein NTW86_16460 [Candidatus Sumerlaeota bacterium]|nr:hypothetical protein [Candidatus Sumerlaeota bacterium]
MIASQVRVRGVVACLCSAFLAGGLWAATPPWTETFASLPGGTFYNGAIPPAGVIPLPVPAEATGNWLVGNDGSNTSNYAQADASFAVGGLPSGGSVPAENDHRLIIGNVATNNTQLRSMFSTGVTDWKYDVYVGIPATTNVVGNLAIGVTVDNGTGAPVHANNPLLNLQINLEGGAHSWRVVRSTGTNTQNTAAPVAFPAVKANAVDRWWKLTFEHNSAAHKFVGYVNDVQDYEYVYPVPAVPPAGLGDAWIMSSSMVMVAAFPANNANVYLDDVTFHGAGSSVEDWRERQNDRR